MRHARVYGIAAALALLAGAVAFAQSTVEPLPDNAPVEVAALDANAVAALAEVAPGDAERGASLAGTCTACHGLDGNPPEGLPYPRLAGQSERYTARQLALFKSGERNTGNAALMVPFAAPLSAQDMRDLGAYFSTQTAGSGIADDAVVAEGPYGGMKFYEIGQKLYRGGDAARQLPACMACHGPAGAGNPGPPYPAIAGHDAGYLETRLQDYRAGNTAQQDRHLFEVMAAVARSLTDEEIRALSSYLQGLHARPDAATLAAIAAGATAPAPAPAAPAPAAPEAGQEADADIADAAQDAARES